MTEKQKIDSELIDEIRKQVLQELEDKEAREKEKERIRREQAEISHADYVMRMKESSEPWVEIVSMNQVEDGKNKIELDWNDAFIEDLRKNGYTGVDDEAIVQLYIAMLSKRVAENMEGDISEFE